jgi:hypothetical protein
MQLKPILAAAGLSLALGAAPATASTITFDQTFQPDDVLFNKDGAACSGNTTAGTVNMFGDSSCESLAFSFSWTGFDPSTDVVDSGTLTLTFFDDIGDVGNGEESVLISLDSLLATPELTIASGGSSPSFGVAAQLNDGLLNVLLTLGSRNRGNNDFYFDSAVISASGTRTTGSVTEPPPGNGVVPVPEPVSLALFGLGLSALGFRLRRRK